MKKKYLFLTLFFILVFSCIQAQEPTIDMLDFFSVRVDTSSVQENDGLVYLTLHTVKKRNIKNFATADLIMPDTVYAFHRLDSVFHVMETQPERLIYSSEFKNNEDEIEKGERIDSVLIQLFGSSIAGFQRQDKALSEDFNQLLEILLDQDNSELVKNIAMKDYFLENFRKLFDKRLHYSKVFYQCFSDIFLIGLSPDSFIIDIVLDCRKGTLQYRKIAFIYGNNHVQNIEMNDDMRIPVKSPVNSTINKLIDIYCR